MVDRQPARVDGQRAEHGAVGDAERLERGGAGVGVGGEDLDVVRGLGDPSLHERPRKALHCPSLPVPDPYDRAMPELHTFVIFAAASAAFLAVPGPSVIYIVSRSLAEGRTAGIVSALGIQAGGLVHVDRGDDRGVGAAGLLGDRVQRRQVRRRRVPDLPRHPQAARAATRTAEGAGGPVPRKQLFWQGVVVNSLNPKTALFFLAFLPQFVDPDRGAVAPQVLALGVLFLVLATLSDSTYALVAGSVRGWLGERRRTLARVSGFSYVGLGVLAALSPASNSSAQELMQ